MGDDRSQGVLLVAVCFLVISWITVLLRVYVRAVMLKGFGADDWTMALTQFFFTAYLICQLGGYAHGTGRHMSDLDPKDAEIALRFWYFCEVFYILASCWLKVSIGLFLLRVAVIKSHVWIIRLIIVGTGIFGLAYLCEVLAQCRPLSTFWTQSPGAPTCFSPSAIVITTYIASIINAGADWTFGILPIFIVKNLKISKRQKIVVAGILAFAAIGSTATLIRIPFISGLGETHDFLWATTGIAITSTVEPGIGIAAGCVATLRPLFQSCLGKASQLSSRGGLGSRNRAATPQIRLSQHIDLEAASERHRHANGTAVTMEDGMDGGKGEESAATSREGVDDRMVDKSFLMSAYPSFYDVEKDGIPDPYFPGYLRPQKGVAM